MLIDEGMTSKAALVCLFTELFQSIFRLVKTFWLRYISNNVISSAVGMASHMPTLPIRSGKRMNVGITITNPLSRVKRVARLACSMLCMKPTSTMFTVRNSTPNPKQKEPPCGQSFIWQKSAKRSCWRICWKRKSKRFRMKRKLHWNLSHLKSRRFVYWWNNRMHALRVFYCHE